jgi:transposase
MKFAVVAVLASAVNPRQIRDHARATGQLAKTGALDARTLAKFAAAVRPEVRPLPDTQTRALDEAVTRRRPLVEMAGAERTLDATARRRSPTQRTAGAGEGEPYRQERARGPAGRRGA